MEMRTVLKIPRIALAFAAGLVLAGASSVSAGPDGWTFPDLYVALLMGGAVTFYLLRDPVRSVSTLNLWAVAVALSLFAIYQALRGSPADLAISIAVSVAYLGILLVYRKVVAASGLRPAQPREDSP